MTKTDFVCEICKEVRGRRLVGAPTRYDCPKHGQICCKHIVVRRSRHIQYYCDKCNNLVDRYELRDDRWRLDKPTHTSKSHRFPPVRQQPTLIAPPKDFIGTIGDFVERFVIPNLPSADRLVAWTEVLLRYVLQNPDPILIVRGPDKGNLRRVEQGLIVDSDNAPGIWCYLRCLDQSFDPLSIPEYIAAGNIPVLMALSANKRDNWNYGQAMSTADKNQLWAKKMKHCHQFPLRTLGLSPKQRSLRNLCPANHFLFPTPKKYRMRRIGWSEALNCYDLGESETIIAFIQNCLIDFLGKEGLRIYDRFLETIAGARSGPISSKLRIQLVREEDGSAEEKRKLTSQPIVSLAAMQTGPPNNAVVRNWTLNERHGYYVATGLRDRAIELSLHYRKLNGETATVGQFLLDLELLSGAGVVARRAVGGEVVFDVRIVRDHHGSFWVGVRNNPTIPLETLTRG